MKGIIDANLLLVLVVGLNDPRLLGRKKHVAEYCKEDFDVLCGVLNDFDRLLVTPNIITEFESDLRKRRAWGKFQ